MSSLNREFITISQLITKLILLQKEMVNMKDKYVGTFNLFDVINKSHYENCHSDIIAYLLDPNEKHFHKEFCEQFISLIRNTKDVNIPDYKFVKVSREKQISNARRIDILIETNSFVMIIENKIWAHDQEAQLFDYYNWANGEYGSKPVFLCYLTPFETPPSEYSILKKDLNELEKSHSYFSLSYNKDILNWLSSLKIKDDEKILNAAIVQYIDIIEGVCNLRKENKMELELAVNEMEAICKNESIELNAHIKEIKTNLEYLQQSCNFYIFMDFFEVLGARLSGSEGLSSSKIYYVHHGNKEFDLNKKKDFIYSVKKDFESFGIKCTLDDSCSLNISIEKLNDSFITYGVFRNRLIVEKDFHLSKSWKFPSDRYNIQKSNDENWIEYVKVPYVVRCLLTTSELKINEIVDNVTSWFIQQLKEYIDAGLLNSKE